MLIVMNLNENNYLNFNDEDYMLDYIIDEFGSETMALASDWCMRSGSHIFKFNHCLIVRYEEEDEYRM